MFPSMEEFSKLKEFGIICHPRKSTQIKQVTWYPPIRGWIRNHHAVILGCFAFHIGIKYVLFAELLAANKAIEICRDKGWQKMWIECDSMLVVQAFKNEHIEVEKYSLTWDFVVSCIYFEGNTCANRLVFITLPLTLFVGGSLSPPLLQIFL
ncbi:hypothetical protein GmHk_06G017374 [Glycine max]|nr:hypothetical protein GmHk_06G017374 [Glycine max]